MKKIIKIWFKMAEMVIQPDLTNFGAILLFIAGKLVRFVLYFWFVFTVASVAKGLAGYSAPQVVLFFLVFTLIDSLTQLFFRGVYQFRYRIVSGDFDLDLLKPWPSYLRPIFGHFDLADFITLIPFLGFSIWFIVRNQLFSSILSLLLFLVMLAVSLLVGFAFHLFVCAICVLTTEVDHVIWIYRDLSMLARFPYDIYQGLVKFLITFVIPIALMFSFPVKTLLGLLSYRIIFLTIFLSFFLVYFSLRFWHWALQQYTSASS